ncbi:hypothetical protein [Vibrio coralliirubri]|uniref:hypothetical protein n=1 Tax=Vibrio coralliirubri TaxID=1516159 RepID=UPI000A57FEAB|nr:hypothetical protein [Vibrio coralliirubri]
MKRILLLLLSISLTACSTPQYTFDSVRQITEASEHFMYTSYEYTFENIRINGEDFGVATSSDGYLKITSSVTEHLIEIDTRDLPSTNLDNFLLVSDTGDTYTASNSDGLLLFSLPIGEVAGAYLVLISGNDYESSIYIPWPNKSCLESTINTPKSCSFSTDECGYLYAGLLASGHEITDDFTYPVVELACNTDPMDREFFEPVWTYPSNDKECRGMTKAQCIFYQR